LPLTSAPWRSASRERSTPRSRRRSRRSA
jgi:hypothetical protein